MGFHLTLSVPNLFTKEVYCIYCVAYNLDGPLSSWRTGGQFLSTLPSVIVLRGSLWRKLYPIRISHLFCVTLLEYIRILFLIVYHIFVLLSIQFILNNNHVCYSNLFLNQHFGTSLYLSICPSSLSLTSIRFQRRIDYFLLRNVILACWILLLMSLPHLPFLYYIVSEDNT